jgi:hypothetical protein
MFFEELQNEKTPQLFSKRQFLFLPEMTAVLCIKNNVS